MEPTFTGPELQHIIREVAPGATVVGRERLWNWTLSRVERVRLDDGSSLVVKRARAPLVNEPRILAALRSSDIPLAEMYSWQDDEDGVTMVMEDLGAPVRQATLADGAAVAAKVHPFIPAISMDEEMDEDGLRGLLYATREGVETLKAWGRWRETDRILLELDAIATPAERLADHAKVPPYGLCHSEFNPTSLHIGVNRTALVDWARAYIGPGLLDLASWFWTSQAPDLPACQSLLQEYVKAGGAREALERRGALPAENWAFFWSRLWAVEWFVRSCTTWMTDATQDEAWRSTIERHLIEAHSMLESRE